MCGGGNAHFSNSACTANGLIFKAYTLQRYSDKKNTNSYSAGQELSIWTTKKGHA